MMQLRSSSSLRDNSLSRGRMYEHHFSIDGLENPWKEQVHVMITLLSRALSRARHLGGQVLQPELVSRLLPSLILFVAIALLIYVCLAPETISGSSRTVLDC